MIWEKQLIRLALQFLTRLKAEKPENKRYKYTYDQLQEWSQKYPEFPNHLLKENGYLPYNEPPSPKGGWQAIANNLRYPEAVRRAGVQGKVVVKTLINEKVNPIDFKIEQSLNAFCDAEAIKAVKSVKFNPAKIKGRASKIWIMLPIEFRLKGA